MTNHASTATEAEVLSIETDEAVKALANAISMQADDPDSEKTSKRKPKSAPKDLNLELAKAKSRIQELERKTISLETDLRVARDSVPGALKKSAQEGVAAAKLAATIMTQASGGMLQLHDILPALWDGTLHLKNGKLVTK